MEMQELIDKLNNETPDNYSACYSAGDLAVEVKRTYGYGKALTSEIVIAIKVDETDLSKNNFLVTNFSHVAPDILLTILKLIEEYIDTPLYLREMPSERKAILVCNNYYLSWGNKIGDTTCLKLVFCSTLKKSMDEDYFLFTKNQIKQLLEVDLKLAKEEIKPVSPLLLENDVFKNSL